MLPVCEFDPGSCIYGVFLDVLSVFALPFDPLAACIHKQNAWNFLNNKNLQTAVLSIMYLSAVGFAMVYGGIYINSIFDGDVPDDLENGVNLVFAGGFITTLFLVCCVLVFIVQQHVSPCS